jgi:hypothetical protein
MLIEPAQVINLSAGFTAYTAAQTTRHHPQMAGAARTAAFAAAFE